MVAFIKSIVKYPLGSLARLLNWWYLQPLAGWRKWPPRMKTLFYLTTYSEIVDKINNITGL